MIKYLEKRFSQWAIPHITIYLLLGQVMTSMMVATDPALFERMFMIPSKVMEGEVYRLLTFIVMPPGRVTVFTLFCWYMLYLMGTALERFWGTFRYNLFLLIGGLATIAAAFLTPGQIATNAFIQGTVFLAFAWLNPNFVIQLFFVLPVRIKWLAMMQWFGYGWLFIFDSWSIRLAVAASVLNFFLFFGKEVWYRASDGRRHMARQARRFTDKPPAYLHKCEACGVTDTEDPKEDFRYCSKCVGDVAYCSEHLRNHAHIVNMPDEGDAT